MIETHLVHEEMISIMTKILKKNPSGNAVIKTAERPLRAWTGGTLTDGLNHDLAGE